MNKQTQRNGQAPHPVRRRGPSARLFYKRTSGWTQLPEWASFFVALGARVAEANGESGTRWVVGVTVPARAFAAVLAAVGVLTVRSAGPVKRPGNKEHIETLRRLSLRHPVVLRDGNKQLKGIFQGVSRRNYAGAMEEVIKVQIAKKGGASHLLPLEEAQKVIPVDVEEMKLPEKNQKGRKVILREEFLRQILGNADPVEFASVSRLECILIGRTGMLRQEITEEHFAVGEGAKWLDTGVLQDTLRVRSLLQAGSAYRSEIHRADKPPVMAGESVSCPIIFDGAAGFLRSRSRWPRSPLIVILDRTDPHCEEAIEALNQDYIQRRIGDGRLDGLPPVSPGLELMMYEESC